MKKRLICLCLCLLMVLPLALTACSSEEGDSLSNLTYATGSTAKAKTITINTIKNPSMTDEAIALVQDAINTYTEQEFNTHVVLRMYTEEEYKQVMAEKMAVLEKVGAVNLQLKNAATAAIRAVKSAGADTTPSQTAETEAEETVMDEYGMEKSKYPEVTENQLDIFLITDYETYVKYVEADQLAPLDTMLSVSHKVLSTYINPVLMSAAYVGNNIYALQNNRMVGEYEYILLDRELVDKYYFDPDSISVMSDLSEFLDVISRYETDYVPMVNLGSSFAYYCIGEPSLIGSYLTNSALKSGKASADPVLLLTKKQYRNYLEFVYNYGDMIEERDNLSDHDFACAVVRGSSAICELYKEDYYVIEYKAPVLEKEDLYSSMYAISSFTEEPSRAMEVLHLLTTNEEIINLLAYGIENVHYEKNYDGTITILNDDYSINPAYAGNQFKLWQTTSMTEEEKLLSADEWSLAKKQNLTLSVNPYFGFELADNPKLDDASDSAQEETDESAQQQTHMHLDTLLEGLDALYQDFESRIAAFQPYTDEKGKEIGFLEFLDILALEYANSPYVQEALNTDYSYSIVSQYVKFASGK